MPKVSVVIPFHWMKDWQKYLVRCLESIEKQTFTDYEVILAKHSTMPITSNRAFESAEGELIKVLYMDDYLAHPNALQDIVSAFTEDTKWLVTGCMHDSGKEISGYHCPSYNQKIYTGANTIGSPSVLTMRREALLLFDIKLSWLLDVDLYKKLHDQYGLPTIIDSPNVVIGIHDGQTSNLMSDADKLKELEYVMEIYE